MKWVLWLWLLILISTNCSSSSLFQTTGPPFESIALVFVKDNFDPGFGLNFCPDLLTVCEALEDGRRYILPDAISTKALFLLIHLVYCAFWSPMMEQWNRGLEMGRGNYKWLLSLWRFSKLWTCQVFSLSEKKIFPHLDYLTEFPWLINPSPFLHFPYDSFQSPWASSISPSFFKEKKKWKISNNKIPPDLPEQKFLITFSKWISVANIPSN